MQATEHPPTEARYAAALSRTVLRNPKAAVPKPSCSLFPLSCIWMQAGQSFEAGPDKIVEVPQSTTLRARRGASEIVG